MDILIISSHSRTNIGDKTEKTKPNKSEGEKRLFNFYGELIKESRAGIFTMLHNGRMRYNHQLKRRILKLAI